MNFISEIFEFGALQIQPTTARGSEGASVGSWQPFSIACCRHKEHRFTQNKFSAPTLLPFARISFRRGETTLSSLWVLQVASPRAGEQGSPALGQWPGGPG